VEAQSLLGRPHVKSRQPVLLPFSRTEYSRLDLLWIEAFDNRSHLIPRYASAAIAHDQEIGQVGRNFRIQRENMRFRHVFQQYLSSQLWAVDDRAECSTHGRAVGPILQVVRRLVQLVRALDVARKDVNDVEAGLAISGKVSGGLVGDEFRVCVSFEDVGKVFCCLAGKTLFDIICFCWSAMPEGR
jgi:hypothetical protein